MASNTTSENGDVEEAEFEIVEGENGAADLDRAAIDMQVTTAKQYPRSIDKSLKEAKTLATKNEEVASSCFYAIPRGGGTVKGPSVRLAEIMAYTWGNLRAEADIIDIGRKNVTAMGTAFDLEKNVAVRKRVKRNILTSEGDRYSEDMIGVTSNAAMSIAFRNAVFSVIPQPFVQEVYQEAQLASIGKKDTFEEKLQACLEWFSGKNVSEDQVFDLLEVNGPDDVDEDNLIDLRGLVTAIEDGETTIDQVFSNGSSSPKTDKINEWAQNGQIEETDSQDQADEPSESDQQDDESDDDDSPSLTPEEKLRANLQEYNKDELKNRCDERDLNVSGTKDELIERLIEDELSDSEDTASNESDSSDESPGDSAETDESDDGDNQADEDVGMNDFLTVCQPYLNEFISIAHMKSTIEEFGGTKEVLDAMEQYLEDVENGDVDLKFGENNELPISSYIEGGQ